MQPGIPIQLWGRHPKTNSLVNYLVLKLPQLNSCEKLRMGVGTICVETTNLLVWFSTSCSEKLCLIQSRAKFYLTKIVCLTLCHLKRIRMIITCYESLVMQIPEGLCLVSKQLRRVLNCWQLHTVTYKSLTVLAQELGHYGTSVLWCK